MIEGHLGSRRVTQPRTARHVYESSELRRVLQIIPYENNIFHKNCELRFVYFITI